MEKLSFRCLARVVPLVVVLFSFCPTRAVAQAPGSIIAGPGSMVVITAPSPGTMNVTVTAQPPATQASVKPSPPAAPVAPPAPPAAPGKNSQVSQTPVTVLLRDDLTAAGVTFGSKRPKGAQWQTGSLGGFNGAFTFKNAKIKNIVAVVFDDPATAGTDPVSCSLIYTSDDGERVYTTPIQPIGGFKDIKLECDDGEGISYSIELKDIKAIYLKPFPAADSTSTKKSKTP